MTWNKLKKYENRIKSIAHRRANKYIDPEDLIQAAYEKLLAFDIDKCKKENIEKNIVGTVFRGILSEVRNQMPRGYKTTGDAPIQCELKDCNKSFRENNTDKILIKEILKKSNLKERDKRILELLFQGYTKKEIAQELQVTTARIHQIFFVIRKKVERMLAQRPKCSVGFITTKHSRDIKCPNCEHKFKKQSLI